MTLTGRGALYTARIVFRSSSSAAKCSRYIDYIFAADSIWVYLLSNFRDELRKTIRAIKAIKPRVRGRYRGVCRNFYLWIPTHINGVHHTRVRAGILERPARHSWRNVELIFFVSHMQITACCAVFRTGSGRKTRPSLAVPQLLPWRRPTRICLRYQWSK